MSITITEASITEPSAGEASGSHGAPKRRGVRHLAVVAVAALLGTLGVAAASPGTASAAPQQGVLDTNAPHVVDGYCNYHQDLPYADDAFYTQFWSYDASRGGWSADAWRYTSIQGDWQYIAGRWMRDASNFRPPPSSGTVYIWARTYSPDVGWYSYKMGRCIGGRHYNGWG